MARSKGGAKETRRRILDAAVHEFADLGIGGARVDRIAETAESSKPMIYFHFGCKEGLFNAVFDAELERADERLVLDAADLPAYVGNIYDRLHTEQGSDERTCLQLSMWSKLERKQFSVAPPSRADWNANKRKIEKLRAAQEAGQLNDRIPAAHLLALIEAMAATWMFDELPDETEQASRRQSIVTAVNLLLEG
jgi:AcrR family transcriptional regulator